MARDSYHHGDLKRALIDTALEVLADDGLQALSLRKVARRAGVSHNAPYMHFDDKGALLAAIAEEGFRELERAMREARDATPPGSLEQLVRLGGAYLDFARRHPQHFRLMFAGDGAPSSGAGIGTFELLVDLLASAQRSGVLGPGGTREMAIGFWALLHGVATLRIAGRLGPEVLVDVPPEGLDERLLRQLVRGLATGS